MIKIRDWEPSLHDIINIHFGRLYKLGYILIAFLFVISALEPGIYRSAVPLTHHEVSI